ncbi:MAG: hypothetical protein RIS34_2084 [Pseudomonadota bacterium]|jgi:hypothetical protein
MCLWEGESAHKFLRHSLVEHRRQFHGRLDTQLFVHILAAKHHFNAGRGYAKQWRQKPHHVIGRLACLRCSGHAHLELCALGLANGVFGRTGFAEYVDHQHVTFPGEK